MWPVLNAQRPTPNALEVVCAQRPTPNAYGLASIFDGAPSNFDGHRGARAQRPTPTFYLKINGDAQRPTPKSMPPGFERPYPDFTVIADPPIYTGYARERPTWPKSSRHTRTHRRHRR